MKVKDCRIQMVAALVVCAIGPAHAQNSVNLSGTIDVGVRVMSNTGQGSFRGVGTQGNTPSRLNFSGKEDLGGGLTAGFSLESGFLPDTGQSVGQVFGIGFWNRGSYVSLKGNFGEVRFGRDWTVSYDNMWIYDPSYGNGLGDTLHVSHNLGQPTYFLTNNAISYFLPGGLGGLYGHVMVAPGEGSSNGRYAGARMGYSAGSFDVAVGVGSQDVTGGKFKTANVGGSYDFGAAKVTALWNREKVVDATETRTVLGVTVPLGAHYAWASWAKSSVSDYPGAHGASQIAAGYVYSLSKRTALYGAASYLDNKGQGQLSVTNFGTFTSPSPTPGGSSRGVELGVRHNF